MCKINIPVGVSDFEQIRKNEYYYVDKSGMIAEILSTESTLVTLITRPRRFGKTLGMSMLASFFDIRKDSRNIFAGLEIAENRELCDRWMNQYPVIFLSFKDVDGLTFTSAYEMLAATITDLYKEHLYLLGSDKINPYDQEIIRRLVEGKASVTEVKRSLSLLITFMKMYYGKPVILLLDEYDVPVAKASDHGYYVQMLEIVKALMSTSLKDNPALKFAVLTGCLKIAKESIFTGTNNFVSDTISVSRLNEYFGFTQTDVDKLLTDAGKEEHAQQIKIWYDGYHFGDVDVYCPWDVMNYLRDLQKNPDTKPESYWKNTSDNAIIRSFIDYAGSSITNKLESLMAGNYITQHIEDDLTYDYLHSSENNFWSVLYLTGYLTQVREYEMVTSLPDGISALKIPNAEIREIFESTVQTWFMENAKSWNRKHLFDAVWNEDVEKMTKEMNKLLRMTISYHDYREDYYHAFLAGIFAGAGYMVESNKEHGEGRSDIVITDVRESRAAVLEVKYARTLDKLESSCREALRQIDERMYAEEFRDNYDQVLCFGVAFYKKKCLVMKK
ncbi:MAG TPA: ATP-binding protein [Candidatus Anaerobutyricum stercoris]|uniref:ATP-binding protein n=1 Tax=Candidatus Anaerobutyricum stercoris TaxID=2838457 RepID=A0A9D2J8J3_9FIRM|nr:ATP-binding protein [Candidatus Anaerobutyricum stercoris]